MPLSWYFWPQWEYQFGKYWKDSFCNDWFEHEREGDKFAITLWRYVFFHQAKAAI